MGNRSTIVTTRAQLQTVCTCSHMHVHTVSTSVRAFKCFYSAQNVFWGPGFIGAHFTVIGMDHHDSHWNSYSPMEIH